MLPKAIWSWDFYFHIFSLLNTFFDPGKKFNHSVSFPQDFIHKILTSLIGLTDNNTKLESTLNNKHCRSWNTPGHSSPMSFNDPRLLKLYHTPSCQLSHLFSRAGGESSHSLTPNGLVFTNWQECLCLQVTEIKLQWPKQMKIYCFDITRCTKVSILGLM